MTLLLAVIQPTTLQCPAVLPCPSPSNIPAIVSALGIFTSAVVALMIAVFKEDWYAGRHRPDLKFDLLMKPPHSHLTYFTNFTPQRPVYYFRFWVENEGKGRALDVELVVTEVYEWSGSSWVHVKTLPQMNLKWAHLGAPVLPGISRKMGRHCDFAYVADPGQASPVLEIVVEVAPANRVNVLTAGRYRICFRLGASNFDPFEKWYEIDFGGVWHPTESLMLTKGITVVESESPV